MTGISMKEMAKFLILCGVVLIVMGGILLVAGKIPGLGRLPGDITLRHGDFSFYFPLTTCLILSLVLTVLFNFFSKR